MEYGEGDSNKLFRASRDDFTIDEIVVAFVAYRDGTFDWNDYGEWERIL